MTKLELKKLEAELARVKASRLEMECRLEELTEAMTRINKDVEIQLKKEIELTTKLEGNK